MRVELVRFTPEPEKAVAAAARLCYSELLPGSLAEAMSDGEARRMIKLLIRSGHTSPFEHASFTFAISGVSRSLTHQLVRHRIASYSQRSQRYVSEEQFHVVTPPSVRMNGDAKVAFDAAMEDAARAYRMLIDMGIPKEDARYVLPNSCATAVMATFNARSLLNFFSLRCCRRAQWEIRAVAFKMLREVRAVAPALFSLAGPNCLVKGVCLEGKFSCGLVNRLRRGTMNAV